MARKHASVRPVRHRAVITGHGSHADASIGQPCPTEVRGTLPSAPTFRGPERIPNPLVRAFAVAAAQLLDIAASRGLERRLDLPATCEGFLDLNHRLVGVEVVFHGEQLSPAVDPEERTSRSRNIDPAPRV